MIRDLFRMMVPEATRARWQLRFLVRQQWRSGERELRLLPHLVDPRRAAFDVGANRGLYSWFLRRWAIAVHAFEPQPRLARRIRQALGSSVSVHPVALSSRRGKAFLHVPRVGREKIDAYASLQPDARHAWQEHWTEESIEVELVPLDELDLPAPGFIKIDAEGHEPEVLEGARKNLERQRPVLLLELDERNRSGVLDEVPRRLAALGYRGFFLLGRELVELEKFERQTHQNAVNVGEGGALPGRIYINNFIFLAEPEATARAGAIAARADLRP